MNTTLKNGGSSTRELFELKHMKVIVFEATVYKVNEKQFAQIEKQQTADNEMLMSDFLERNKSNYKLIGEVDFDFRL